MSAQYWHNLRIPSLPTVSQWSCKVRALAHNMLLVAGLCWHFACLKMSPLDTKRAIVQSAVRSSLCVICFLLCISSLFASTAGKFQWSFYSFWLPLFDLNLSMSNATRTLLATNTNTAFCIFDGIYEGNNECNSDVRNIVSVSTQSSRRKLISIMTLSLLPV